MKAPGSTRRGQEILSDLRTVEVSGILSVAVKCVDIKKNTRGEGGLLGCF